MIKIEDPIKAIKTTAAAFELLNGSQRIL